MLHVGSKLLDKDKVNSLKCKVNWTAPKTKPQFQGNDIEIDYVELLSFFCVSDTIFTICFYFSVVLATIDCSQQYYFSGLFIPITGFYFNSWQVYISHLFYIFISLPINCIQNALYSASNKIQ